MKIEICDRCKKLPNEPTADTNLITCTVVRQGYGAFIERWIGHGREITLCNDCFQDFWEIIN